MASIGGEWRFARLLFVVTIVTSALYFGKNVVIPFVLAVLLGFLLSPLVSRIERWGFRRIPAVLAVTLCTLVCSVCLGWVVLGQFVGLVENLPSHRENIELRLRAFNGRIGLAIKKAIRNLQKLAHHSPTERTPASNKPTDVDESDIAITGGAERLPVRVAVVDSQLTSLNFFRDVFGSLLAPIGIGAIVMILVVFMLIGREELRDRLIRLLGTTHMNVTIDALDDAGQRVSRYLLTQFALNAVCGAAISVGLYFIGVPNALIWGLLATALRFIPLLGFWLSAAIPLLLALASPTWVQPLQTIALYGTVELIMNFLEPRLFGSSTGLSTVAILGASLFWAWLWGAIGLLLAVPLTVVLVVMGRHVPRLAFLHVLLGDGPALQPHVRLYQRMLATDCEETEDLFETFTKDKTLIEAYDAFALPALGLAESDFHMDQIDDERRRLVHENMKELIQGLGERRRDKGALALPKSYDLTEASPEATRLAGIPVMCLPARDEADEIACMMLAQVLQGVGATTNVASVAHLTGELLEMIEKEKVKVICISAVPPSGLRNARYLYKRIRTRYPKIPIVAALWGSKLAQDKAKRLMGCSEDDTIAKTVADVAQQIMSLVDREFLRQQELRKTQTSVTDTIRLGNTSTLTTSVK